MYNDIDNFLELITPSPFRCQIPATYLALFSQTLANLPFPLVQMSYVHDPQEHMTANDHPFHGPLLIRFVGPLFSKCDIIVNSWTAETPFIVPLQRPPAPARPG